MDPLVEKIRKEIDGAQAVRQELPGGGRMYIERPLPFLCLYRTRPIGQDRGTRKLVLGEASFLIAPGNRSYHEPLRELVRTLAGTLSKRFGAFLLLEVCAGLHDSRQEEDPAPRFRVFSQPDRSLTPTIETVMHALKAVRIQKQGATVEVLRQFGWGPPGLPPLFSPDELADFQCETMGLEVRPVYRDGDGNLFPTRLQNLKTQVSRALRKGFHSFSVTRTTESPVSYQALGQRIVARSASRIDEELAEVSQTFDLLFQITPVNMESAWLEFSGNGFERAPAFIYRPLPLDPVVVKRRLLRHPYRTYRRAYVGPNVP